MATTATYGRMQFRWHYDLWLGGDYALVQKEMGEFSFLISHAQSFGAGAVVLDLATCGARIPMVLAKAGIKKIYAMDASDEVLAEAPKALQKNLTPEERGRIILLKGDMRWFSLPEPVDLVTVAFQSFWYNFGVLPRRHVHALFDHEERATRFLFAEARVCVQSIIKALRRGGKFIINAPYVYLYKDAPYSGDIQKHDEAVIVAKNISWWTQIAAELSFSFEIQYYSDQEEKTNFDRVLVGTKL